MSPQLKVCLLGQPQIKIDTLPLKIVRRQTRALLFFLAGSGGMLGRSELIEKFFGADKISDDVARRRLRELISKLRSDLPDSEMVITANDQVGLDLRQVEVDVIEFERLCQSVDVHLKKHIYGQALPAQILPTLESAVALWQGSDFMQGLILDDELLRWQIEKNAHLLELRENLLKHLGGHAAAINDLEAAAHWLRTALEPNQYTNVEDVYHLLVILKKLGRLNEALKLANLLKKRYDTDEETMPAALESLCSDITSQFSTESGGDWDAWGKTFFTQTPLVGRHAELKKLQSAYREKQAVIIWGDTGMGKSRLVHEFYHKLSIPPHLMVATCRQMEQHQPFEPLLDMLEQFMTPDDWEALEQNTIRQLAFLIPDKFRSLNWPVQFETVQPLPEMVNEAIYQVLQLKAASSRVLLFLKNVQWCDESSLNALAYLLEKGFFRQQGFLVLTGLASEKKAAFDRFINTVNRKAHPYEIIFLNALNEKDVRQLVEEILGTPLSADVVHKMTTESGGSPFIISEYLRWHLQKNPGKKLKEMMKDAAIPSNVSSLMRARLKELDPQLRLVINAAAVVGEQFNLNSVTVVADLIKEEAVSALERMEDMHLIKPVVKFDPIGGYTFTYPRMRQLVLNEIKTARKQLMYQRMANYLEARSGQRMARPSVLAQYFQNGGDDARAFAYWYLAARNAFQKYSFAEAEAAIKAGEAILLRDSELIDDEQITQFLSLYMDICRGQGDNQSINKIARVALDLGQRRSSHPLLGTGLRFRALCEVEEGRMAAALETIEEALRHLRHTSMMHELLRTYNISGILQNMSGAVEQSARTFESTNQLAEKARIEHPDDMRIVREMALANDGLASMDVLHGLPLIAATRAGLAIDAMEMSFDYGGLTHAQTTLAEAMNQMGDHTLALETSARAVRSSLGLQWNNLAASAQVVFAHTNILLGNLDAGWQALEKTFEICETNHLVEEKACFHLIRGKVFRLFEDFEKAIDEFKTAMALKCSPYTTAETLLNYGMSLQLANRPEEGALMVKEAFDMALRYEFVALRLTIENIKAADKGAQGDFDGACKLLQDLAELSNQRGLKQIAAAIYFNYGSFMLAKGNFFVARRLVQSLVNPETAQGPWTVMRGLVLMDRINRREGLDDDTPRQRLVEVFEHLRSSTHVEPFKTQVAHFSRNILRQVDDG